jgi:hypothetical protein
MVKVQAGEEIIPIGGKGAGSATVTVPITINGQSDKGFEIGLRSEIERTVENYIRRVA